MGRTNGDDGDIDDEEHLHSRVVRVLRMLTRWVASCQQSVGVLQGRSQHSAGCSAELHTSWQLHACAHHEGVADGLVAAQQHRQDDQHAEEGEDAKCGGDLAQNLW